MQTPMYVEVPNIMVCNQHVSDPNKHEQTSDVVKERLCHLSDSWEHLVDRRERRRHSNARTHADTHTHTCTHTDTWHSRTHTHTRTRTHACADTRAHTHVDTHTYTRTHTHHNKLKCTHTHDADTHSTRTHARRYTQETRGGEAGVPLPAHVSLVRGETVEVGQKREGEILRIAESFY